MKTPLLLIPMLLPLAAAQGPGRQAPSHEVSLQGTREPGIAWFGLLEEARAEAKRTGKPLFLMSASPSCSGVPGMW